VIQDHQILRSVLDYILSQALRTLILIAHTVPHTHAHLLN